MKSATRLWLVIILASVIVSAQSQDSVSTAVMPPPEYYTAPMLEEVWQYYRSRIYATDDSTFTREYMQLMLDSLLIAVVDDFDELARRARALDTTEKGYTHQYFRSEYSRLQLMGDPITKKQAESIPHFHAVYDPQGYLTRVRFVEPRKWRARQQLLANRKYQPRTTTPPLVRYFRGFDLKHFKGVDYVKRKKLVENRPYYRMIYDDNNAVSGIERYNSVDRLVFSIKYRSTDTTSYADVEFTSKEGGSLLDLHPYAFMREWSRVDPNWRVAITRDENGDLASVQAFNEYKQLAYYYTYGITTNFEEKTLTLRCTALSDSGHINAVFSMVYDDDNRIIRRSHYTATGELLRTSTFEYLPKLEKIVITNYNAAGIEISRQSIDDPPLSK